MHRNAVATGVFHAAQHQHLGAARRHLEHLLVADRVQPARVGHDPRVGGEDAVDVGVDLADVGIERRGQRDGGGVRAAAAERGDVLGVLADALEAGDQHDVALVERGADPARGDVDDPGVAVVLVVITPACDPVNERACAPASRWPSRPARWRSVRPRSAACPSRAAAATGRPAWPGRAGRRWCRPSPKPRRRRRCPSFLVSTIRSATRRMRSASDTEDPPYFCTTSDTDQG